MPLNTVAKNEALKSSGGIAGAITHIGVCTADPGTGTNANPVEATGGTPAYTRQAVTWGTPAAGQLVNTNAFNFDVPAGTYVGFLLWSAATGNTNTYRGWLPFEGSVKGFGTVDADGLPVDLITSTGHGLAAGDSVMAFNVFAEALPSGLVEGHLYYVLAAGLTADAFRLSATVGGPAVDITAVGDLFWQRLMPVPVAGQSQITVAAGQLVLDLTAI